MLNRAIAGKPDGMTISMHLCRGNFLLHLDGLRRL